MESAQEVTGPVRLAVRRQVREGDRQCPLPACRSCPEKNEGDTALPWGHECPLLCPGESKETQPCPEGLKETDKP